MPGRNAGYINRMFGGLGGSEIVIIAVLFLVIFGPSKLPQMARDIGKFVAEARRSIDEFKGELTADLDEDEKPRKNGGVRRKESLNHRKNGDREKDPEGPSEEAPEETSEEEVPAEQRFRDL